MEMINGGLNWGKIFGVGWTSAMVGVGVATLTIVSMSTPIGWVAASAIVAGSAVAGGVVGGGITAAVQALTD